MRYDRPLPVPLRPDLDHAREAAMTLDRPRPGEIAACEKFWADARARLGRLYRLTDRDLDDIEALLEAHANMTRKVWLVMTT